MLALARGFASSHSGLVLWFAVVLALQMDGNVSPELPTMYRQLRIVGGDMRSRST